MLNFKLNIAHVSICHVFFYYVRLSICYIFDLPAYIAMKTFKKLGNKGLHLLVTLLLQKVGILEEIPLWEAQFLSQIHENLVSQRP